MSIRVAASLVFTSACLIGSSVACAAEVQPIERLNSALQKMRSLDPLVVDVEVAVYVEAQPDRPWLEHKASLRRLGDRVLQTVGSTTILLSPRSTVIVDAARREIRFSESGSRPFESDAALIPETPDWGPEAGTVRYSGVGETGEHYILEPDSAHPVRRADIFLEPVSGRLREIVYRYESESPDAPSRAVIRYHWRDDHVPISNLLNESHYVIRSDGEIRPGEAYSGYRIVEVGQ